MYKDYKPLAFPYDGQLAFSPESEKQARARGFKSAQNAVEQWGRALGYRVLQSITGAYALYDCAGRTIWEKVTPDDILLFLSEKDREATALREKLKGALDDGLLDPMYLQEHDVVSALPAAWEETKGTVFLLQRKRGGGGDPFDVVYYSHEGLEDGEPLLRMEFFDGFDDAMRLLYEYAASDPERKN